MKTDNRIREYIVPVRILQAEGVDNAECLLHPAEQIGLNESDFVFVRGKGKILLDFGKELHGGVRIVTGFGTDALPVRISLGESASEAVMPLGAKGSTNNHALRDITVPLSCLSDMEFFCSGFRFVYLEFLDERSEFRLKAINAVYIHNKRMQVGSFRCSDPIINKIYDTAAYTVQLCAQDYLWDGIKRDRLVWIGDIYPEMRALLSVCADDGCLEKSLDFVKKETPLPGWMNAYPMYSMWWLIILSDYYKLTGNRAYIQAQKDYIAQLLRQIDGCICEDGSFDFGMNFVDWQTHEHADEPEGVRNLCKICADRAQLLEQICDIREGTAKDIRSKLERMGAEVQEKKQIVAMKYFANAELSAKEKEILVTGGAKGFSTFMSYFLLSAVSEIASTSQAVAAMKEYYGGMLTMGATTFWEDFDLSWTKNASRIDGFPKPGEKDIHGDYGAFCYTGFRHSLCHGWASGVIAYLTETVLGIIPTGIGGQRIKIEPHLSGLKHVKGSYPCGNGEIEVEYKINSKGEIESRIIAPAGIELVK